MSTSTTVITERIDKEKIIVKFNRPEVLNALNTESLKRLYEVLKEIKNDPELKIIYLTGAGERAFSAGADIEFLQSASPFQIRELARLAGDVTELIEGLGKIVIAVINGYALGGGLEIAEACMFRVASKDAKLGHPEVKIGAVAGWGGTARLPRLVGRAKATELLLTGKIITAEEAYEIGLVNRIGPSEQLMTLADALADELLQCSPTSVWLTWEAMQRGLDMSLGDAIKLGADYFTISATTWNFKEGTSAFLQKRKPRFKGL